MIPILLLYPATVFFTAVRSDYVVVILPYVVVMLAYVAVILPYKEVTSPYIVPILN